MDQDAIGCPGTGSDPLAGFTYAHTYAHVKLRAFGALPGRAALKMIDKSEAERQARQSAAGVR